MALTFNIKSEINYRDVDCSRSILKTRYGYLKHDFDCLTGPFG